MTHPLRRAAVVQAVTAAASAHRGGLWLPAGFTDLSDRSSHPCGILHGEPFSVFAKLAGPDGADEARAELAALALVSQLAGVATPVPVGSGLIASAAGQLLVFEALPERGPADRSAADWAAIGRTLAALHQVHAASFGLRTDSCFGPYWQDNRPVASNRWADFYAERRLEPMLRRAVTAGAVGPDQAAGLGRIIARLPDLSGPEPVPSLLHGDAQRNNFVSVPAGAVVIDPAPWFGHPEFDLALLDYFDPVPERVFAAYQELAPVDPGFAGRRELWRLYAYLAVVAADGTGADFARRYADRMDAAIQRYR
jgi:protein-ribulosamine 3-kinase